MTNFTHTERAILCDIIAGDSIRKLELLPVAIQDLTRAFSTLGLNDSKLTNISNTIIQSINELEHLRNVASFGTTNDEVIDANLQAVLEDLEKE